MDFFDFPVTLTEIVFACHVPKGQGDAVHENRASHGLALHLSGKRIYRFSDGVRIDVTGDDLIYLPEGSSYSVRTEELGECYAVNFHIAEELSAAAPARMRFRNLLPCAESFRSAEAAFRTRSIGWREGCLSDTYAILSLLKAEREAAYTPSKTVGRLAPAVEKIHASFCDGRLSVDGLAALTGVGTVYFRRLFERVYGVSPVKYILSLRLLRAKELLASGLYTVEKTAELSGFSDLSYFCRRFRTEVGMTPTEYKNSVK